MDALLMLALFIGGAIVLFRVICWVFLAIFTSSQAELEEAKAERQEAENDAARLALLREKRARNQREASAPRPEPILLDTTPAAPLLSPKLTEPLPLPAYPLEKEERDATR